MTSVTTLTASKCVRLPEKGTTKITVYENIIPVDNAEPAADLIEDGHMNLKTIATIYEETFPVVYRYIARRIGDEESARDLTSDVFSSLLQSVERGRSPEGSPLAWLFHTAHNAVIDYYRSQTHRNHTQLDENVPKSGSGLEKLTETRLMAEQAREALAMLTADQQQVIALRFLEGMSLAEVAEIVGKPIGAVKSLQYRGLMALQRHLTLGEERVPT